MNNKIQKRWKWQKGEENKAYNQEKTRRNEKQQEEEENKQ